MSTLGLDVRHVLLDCVKVELHRRIENDEEDQQASDWRAQHVVVCLRARSWMCEAAELVVDTARLAPEDVASTIIDALGDLADPR